jgi:hypothetical protein
VWRCGNKRQREKDKEKQKIERNRDNYICCLLYFPKLASMLAELQTQGHQINV